MRRSLLLLVGFAAVLASALVASAGSASEAVTASGEIVFARGKQYLATPDLYVMRSDGSNVRLLVRNADEPAVSRDGTRIAFVRKRAIWVMRRDGSGQRQLTRPPTRQVAHDYEPAWSPDGRTIYFGRYSRVKDRSGSQEWRETGPLFSIASDGTDLRRLTGVRADHTVYGPCHGRPAPSPDGRLIAYDASECDRPHLWGLAAVTNSGRTARLPFRLQDVVILTETWDPAWAPDGRQFAFAAEEQDPLDTSLSGLYLCPSHQSRPRHLVASFDIYEPAWSPDSTMIAFVRTVSEPNGYPGDIWLVRPDGKGLHRLTGTRADDGMPAWLPPAR